MREVDCGVTAPDTPPDLCGQIPVRSNPFCQDLYLKGILLRQATTCKKALLHNKKKCFLCPANSKADALDAFDWVMPISTGSIPAYDYITVNSCKYTRSGNPRRYPAPPKRLTNPFSGFVSAHHNQRISHILSHWCNTFSDFRHHFIKRPFYHIPIRMDHVF